MEAAMKQIAKIAAPTAMKGSLRAVRRPIMLTLVVASALVSAPVPAQRGDADEERDCINLREIDRTRVANEDTILFYMRGGDVYRNDLPNRCPNLDFDERFMYRVNLNRLCDTDVITVIDDVGFGFMPGASCSLGKFRPVTDEEAEDLTEPRRERGRDRN
jgi:hypothetical protein